ncbi:cobyrinate a,c-diamide synthase [Humidesulfovibrio sp.]
MPKALVLAGTHSGCGKTSATLGLLRALVRRGLRVQPFKSGPDFIDPGLHAAAAKTPSHNLDAWMQPPHALRELFARHARGADVVVVEGAMGLFDGLGAEETGSSAHLAKLLGLPVLLVVDAKAQARSAAALVRGFARFDPDLRLAGVLLNRVGSARHQAILREALAQAGDAPVLGCLGRSEAIGLPSRHLGLVTAADADGLEVRLEALADWVEQGVDLAALLAALPELPPSVVAEDVSAGAVRSAERSAVRPAVRLGIARDRAFCFLYEENLRLLAQAGAELVFFSPLADAALPVGLDGLYLPGGYPELSARELAANASMRASVRDFCASGRPVWAECGGYMYLLAELAGVGACEAASGTARMVPCVAGSEAARTGDSEALHAATCDAPRTGDGGSPEAQPMCGALPGRAVLRARRAALGYRQARTLRPGPFGPAGTLLRGHEFHYSEYEAPAGASPAPAFALTASDGREALDGQARGNMVGGYFHAHLASNPQAAQAFVDACRRGATPDPV